MNTFFFAHMNDVKDADKSMDLTPANSDGVLSLSLPGMAIFATPQQMRDLRDILINSSLLDVAEPEPEPVPVSPYGGLRAGDLVLSRSLGKEGAISKLGWDPETDSAFADVVLVDSNDTVRILDINDLMEVPF